ncbi:MAG: TIGR03790 family protein [Ignavibacteriaceae bacterium]|jgi:uncharacterized protein (TIGR03790 family)|nr:TIGR03790 family protein [Ignavibacteriaceae bacterium]
MKHFLFVTALFLLCSSLANIQAQTNANIPGPENVLVVYKLPDPNNPADTISRAIKDYYVNARNIPAINVVPGLDLPRKVISVGDWSDPHVVKLGFDDQNIVDSTWEKWDTTHCVDTAKFHAYQYYIEEVANPIRLHIQENNLGSIIRYLVICQGVPYKIQAAGDWSVPGNISVDGLLAMLNTPNYDDFVEAIFNNYTTQCYAGCDSTYSDCYSSPFISNPYYNKDPYFEMNSRFLPDYYTGNWAGYNYKLSYLVSRLDGLSFEIITDMIDRSVAADVTGEKTWILDGGGPGSGYISDANNVLTNLGFSTEYNSSKNNWITTSPDEVIGYTSAGVHQGMPTRYIQDLLNFNYANGAIFNTYESYNGYSIGTLRRGGAQGLMTEFTLTGGTGGTGNSWEPYESYVVHSDIYFSSYAVGYTQIDAAWLGMPKLAWRNVVVGDPLTRIYNYSQITLASDSTITGGDIFEGIVVPEGKTLTIAGNAQLNFKRNSSLRVFGTVIINNNSNVSFDSFSELRINAGGKIIINQYANVEFNNYSRLNIYNNGRLISGSYSDIVFNDQTSYSNNGLHTFNLYSEAAFNGSSSMIVKGKMCINEACNLYFNNQRGNVINGSLICLGSLNKEVNMFFGGNSKSLDFQNGDTLK